MILIYARTFLETYRTGSVTKAADALGITQPAASAHIKGLETSIGKPLFLREGRGLKPTPIADDLASSLSSPLDDAERVLNSAKVRSPLIEGTVHIAGPGEFIQFMAAKAMIGLLPLGISLRLKTGKRDFVIDQIEKGETDLAILASDYKNKSVHSKVIYTEKLIPVATPEWAARNLSKPYMPELLIGKPLIAYSENLPLIELYFKTLSNIDIQENAAVTVPDLRIVLQFVLRGAGYSILPDYICAEELQRGSLINLYDHKDNPLNKLYLVWPKLNLRDPRVVFVKDHLLTQFLQEN